MNRWDLIVKLEYGGVMEKLSIGKMARINNVTVQTLRHYDQIGLLKPYLIDEISGYRYYHIKQSAVLDMIVYMKALGMQLEDIKEQFDKEDIDVIKTMLHEQKKSTHQKIKELQQMQSAIQVCIDNYDRYPVEHKMGTIEIQHIKKRKIFCYDSKKNIYEHSLADYEYILRELKNQVIIRDLPMIYFCNVGTILRKAMLDDRKMYSTELFLFIDDNYEHETGIDYLPENDFLCMYCPSFTEELDYAKKLFEYIEAHNYKIIGDYICEVVVELPIFDRDERNMLIKLQIPIEKY